METKVCKSCGRKLSIDSFRKTRWGGHSGICNSCVTEKQADTRYSHTQTGGGKTAPFSDPDFDNLSVGEVVRLMGRAKRWLESRGCSIKLDGEYREVKVRKLKPE